MTITKEQNGSALTLSLEGRLDTMTAPQLEAEISGMSTGITSLTLDFTSLEYISSAGLRVLLAAQKKMNTQGEMTLIHVGDDIKEVFDITGFSDILTVKD